MNKTRLDNLKKLMKQRKLDVVILTTSREQEGNANINYFTGFRGNGIFVMKKEPVLVVSAIEFEKAKKTKTKSILLTKITRKEVLKKAIENAKRIGIDKSSISLSQFEELRKITRKSKSKFYDVGKELVNLRAGKEKEEIGFVKKACAICDGIFLEIVNNFRFKMEKELANFIELKIMEKGLQKSFNPIVSSGKNSSDVHHNPSGKIEKGFLILDFGCKVNGYCSDMTRTLYVGKPSEKEKKMYGSLLEIQENTLNLATVGKKCSQLDKFAREKLGEKFSHNLGHGVGLEIHEQPNLSSISKDILGENMIITIEPGIYEEGKYGIRIEDTVLITKKGPLKLTKSPKKLICINCRDK